MGDIAASGGVWVTTLSDEIWAKPETLTGSIGVYGLIPTLDGIYEWAGIQVDGVSTTKAGEWDSRLAMPDYVNKAIQASIDNSYDKFVSKVAENRMMPYKEILAVAGGRIWSGQKALELGLVDRIGNINDAIESSAELADIDDYQVVSYEKPMDPFEIFLSELLDNLDVKVNIDKNIASLLKVINSDYKFIDKEKRLLRPANLAEGSPGKGYGIFFSKDQKYKVGVINLMGNVFMRKTDDVFKIAKEITKKIKLKNSVDFSVVDFHGEITSEKMAIGHFFDGISTCVVGTHTHVPTADTRILEKGTAYQTDIGMCGDYNSVIGMNKENSLKKFLKKKMR